MAQVPFGQVNGLFPVYAGFVPGFDPEQIQQDFAYVIDGGGWKIWKRNGVSKALIPVPEVSGLPKIESRLEFSAAKIPLDLVRRVAAFFRAVYKIHKSEAAGYLFYRAGEWDFVVPSQTATGASAHYDQPPRREGWVIAGTIHSHAAMSAFHSGTDHKDEEGFDGVHITIGKLDSVPEYSCSIVVQGVRRICDPSELIDGMTPVDAVPASWLEAVKEPAPRGLTPPHFQERADRLYAGYFAGEVARDQYLAGLAQLRREAEAEMKRRAEEETRETNRVAVRTAQGTPVAVGWSERGERVAREKAEVAPRRKGGKNRGR